MSDDWRTRAFSDDVMTTQRLTLRPLGVDDAAFVLALLNEPSYIEYIGDKGVRSLDDARRYILDGPVASYRAYGFGLYLVELSAQGRAIGVCGLLKRDPLPDADIGFAFLPAYWSQGYAHEAALAVLAYARDPLRLVRVLAITKPDNNASIRLLGKLGFRFERMARLSEEEDEGRLFALELARSERD